MSEPVQFNAYAEGRRQGRAECEPLAESLRSLLSYGTALRDIYAHPTLILSGPNEAEFNGMNSRLETARRLLVEFDKENGTMICDRCHSTQNVITFKDCSTCGPVPLCPECTTQHQMEIADGEL